MDTIAKNKALWIALAVIVVALVAFFMMRGDQTSITSTDQNEVASTEDVSSGAASISYQQALTKYADHRIQFDSNCQANPNQVTYKDNTGLMLDNRSAVARTIKIGSTYTIKAWGFKIITLPDTVRASKTILVDCGTSQNVATVLVQE